MSSTAKMTKVAKKWSEKWLKSGYFEQPYYSESASNFWKHWKLKAAVASLSPQTGLLSPLPAAALSTPPPTIMLSTPPQPLHCQLLSKLLCCQLLLKLLHHQILPKLLCHQILPKLLHCQVLSHLYIVKYCPRYWIANSSLFSSCWPQVLPKPLHSHQSFLQILCHQLLPSPCQALP